MIFLVVGRCVRAQLNVGSATSGQEALAGGRDMMKMPECKPGEQSHKLHFFMVSASAPPRDPALGHPP